MLGLLIAQGGHEPPIDHGVVLMAIVVIAIVGALLYGGFRLLGQLRARRIHAGARDQDRAGGA